jgi:Ser/Thr protein kinase RdoA (MazF antagonist)
MLCSNVCGLKVHAAALICLQQLMIPCTLTILHAMQLCSARVLTTTWVDGKTPGQLLRQARKAGAAAAAAATAPQQTTPTSTSQSLAKQPLAKLEATQLQQTQQQQQQQQQQRHDTSPAELQQQLLQLVTMGVEASLCQLVTTGVLHADPHPGNLLLTPGGQLAYIDFGLLVQVPPTASLVRTAAADDCVC